jgi:5-methylcytosine-specific restriction protein A
MNKRNVSNWMKKKVASDYKYQCAHCNNLVDYTHEIDHIVPLWADGSNDITNLQLLCSLCHAKKTFLENTKRFNYHLSKHEIEKNGNNNEIVCWNCNKIFSVYFKNSHTCSFENVK